MTSTPARLVLKFPAKEKPIALIEPEEGQSLNDANAKAEKDKSSNDANPKLVDTGDREDNRKDVHIHNTGNTFTGHGNGGVINGGFRCG